MSSMSRQTAGTAHARACKICIFPNQRDRSVAGPLPRGSAVRYGPEICHVYVKIFVYLLSLCLVLFPPVSLAKSPYEEY